MAKQCGDLPKPHGPSLVRISGNFLLSKPVVKKSARQRASGCTVPLLKRLIALFTEQGYDGAHASPATNAAGPMGYRLKLDNCEPK